MNRLQDIVAFRCVATHGSFTVAAKVLGLTPSSVTKSIARLEEELGVALLHRSTRALQLTELGANYLKRCSQILLDLDSAHEELRARHDRPSGKVRLSAPPSFGRLTLIPALANFLGLYT